MRVVPPKMKAWYTLPVLIVITDLSGVTDPATSSIGRKRPCKKSSNGIV